MSTGPLHVQGRQVRYSDEKLPAHGGRPCTGPGSLGYRLRSPKAQTQMDRDNTQMPVLTNRELPDHTGVNPSSKPRWCRCSPNLAHSRESTRNEARRGDEALASPTHAGMGRKQLSLACEHTACYPDSTGDEPGLPF